MKQRMKELELADPKFREVRDALGGAALEDVESGYKLAPGMRDEVQQATRAAQYARGNVFGAAPAAEEAFEVGNAAFRLRQQRLANAASYLRRHNSGCTVWTDSRSTARSCRLQSDGDPRRHRPESKCRSSVSWVGQQRLQQSISRLYAAELYGRRYAGSCCRYGNGNDDRGSV